MSSSSANGKRKRTSPSIMQGKRPVTLEDRIGVVATEIMRHEHLLKDFKLEMQELQAELAEKKRFDEFVDIMHSETCMLCRSGLRECVGKPYMAVVSYECACSKIRVVHLGCWTKPFRCSCGQEVQLNVKSGSGKNVRVKVLEVDDD